MTVDNLWFVRGLYLSTTTLQVGYRQRRSCRVSFDGGKVLMEHGKNGLYTAKSRLHNHHKFFKYLIIN
jgi:hypothetical protein